ncbi:hypothetical protein RRG08_019450 [Elysia crispata]|uniref:Uncharacterized protein n=1 Tax=Elysia crispata TaxID=231223 RepID=A0AAE1CW46_9GAST|nr:hypothetical protein RRG08_019450 [Elysia crispata]
MEGEVGGGQVRVFGANPLKTQPCMTSAVRAPHKSPDIAQRSQEKTFRYPALESTILPLVTRVYKNIPKFRRPFAYQLEKKYRCRIHKHGGNWNQVESNPSPIFDRPTLYRLGQPSVSLQDGLFKPVFLISTQFLRDGGQRGRGGVEPGVTPRSAHAGQNKGRESMLRHSSSPGDQRPITTTLIWSERSYIIQRRSYSCQLLYAHQPSDNSPLRLVTTHTDRSTSPVNLNSSTNIICKHSRQAAVSVLVCPVLATTASPPVLIESLTYHGARWLQESNTALENAGHMR